jgi:Asp-tRNA(Asn)/Glu-tRNA(Gln) amidotransferase A subunit family amidase
MATDKSLGMRTTSGAYALKNATANYDAFIVEKAREAGMIVIGKANLAVCVRGSSITYLIRH